jgi:hypothetical protein
LGDPIKLHEAPNGLHIYTKATHAAITSSSSS